MASIFISHSSQDAEICDEVGRHLQQLGHSPLFVHRHPRESDFVGDQDWAKEVGERAASYEIFITLLSSAWQRSDECRVEAKFASRSGRTILPLRLDSDAPIPEGLLANVIPFSRKPTEEHWRALKQALTSVGADPEAFRPQPDRKPFPGLSAFERADAAVYFGRDSDMRAVRELLRRMRRGNRESELPRQCLVVGPSGAGKSSLMRAGVLARLEREPHEWLCPATITPSGDLIAALTDALSTTTGLSRPRIRQALTGRTPDGLMELVKAARERAGQPEAALLFSIDQMEEAFTPELIEETLALLEAHKEMEAALDDPMPMIIMGTLRADSYAGLCNRRDVAALPLTTHRVAPLPIEYLSEVITRPLAVWRRPVRDVQVEPAVVERMIADARRIGGGADAGSGDVLPLVAIALRQFWDDHADTEWFAGLTENHYEETGGLSAIIDEQARRALRAIRKHTGNSEAEVYEALIPAVATADAHGNRVRAWAAASAFSSQFKPALEILRDARLLQTDTRGSEADSRTETVYSVAHEVVLRQWTGLAHALEQQAETLTLKARIRDEAAAWARVMRAQESEKARCDSESEMDPSSYLLLEGDRLGHAKTLDWPETGSAEVSEYIAACDAKQAKRAETLAERERRLDQARQQYLAARAKLASDSGDHLGAMRLALSAWPAEENAEVHGAVLSALATAADRSAFRRQLVGHQSEVTALAWSPDGKKVISGSEDETLMLWNPETGERIGEPMVGHHKVSSVAWSPDGHRLFGGYGLTGYFGGTLMLWDAETGEAVAESMVDELDVQSVDCSPDGRRLISGGCGKTMMLWNAETLESIGDPIRGHESGVMAVAWSPDERRLVSGSNDATLMLWDAESGEGIGEPMTGHKEKVASVSWSPDGRRLVSGSWDGTFMIWNAETGERIGEPTVAHKWGINSVVWSPDGRRLISGGFDEALILWDSEDGKRLDNPMTGHEGAVTSVAWSPDGRRLVSGSSDATLILWDVTSAKRVSEPVSEKRNHFEVAAWSPDARQLVTGHDDRTLRLWDGKTGERIGAPIGGHEAAISFISWSPDGNRLLSGSSDGWDDILMLWDTNSWEGIGKPMNGHQGRVETATWSPDGRRIVSVGNCEPTLIFWDAEVGRRIVTSTRSHSCKVMSVAWSPDSRRLVSGGDDGTLMLWHGETGEPVGGPYISHEEWINLVAWSPDGRLLVSAGWDGWDATLMLWDVDTGRRVGQPMTGHHGKVETIAWSPNGSRLVSGSFDRSLILWDVNTTKQVHTPMTAHKKGVISVAWSPDGRRLVSGCNDGMLIVWHADTGERIGDPLAEPLKDSAWVTSVIWSPNGRELMRFDSAGKLTRWDVPWERLLDGDDLARAVVRRRLRGVEQLTEPELQILRELDGKEPDPNMIIKRWGRGGPEDDPFGDPLEESHAGEQHPDSKANSSE